MSNYYYADVGQSDQPRAGEQEQEQQLDIRPEGVSAKQDDIIQRVAEFVVNSCDSAKYQHKLRCRTKFNSYFSFLDPDHPHHAYYQYLIKSYQYWKGVQDALSANAEQNEEAYAYYQQQLLEEQQQQGYEYYPYNAGQSSYANTESFQYADVSRSARGLAGGQPPYAPRYEEPYDPTAVTSHLSVPLGEPTNAPDEDVDEEYELVLEGGVQKLVARRR